MVLMAVLGKRFGDGADGFSQTNASCVFTRQHPRIRKADLFASIDLSASAW